jgi:hypothetical protein
MTDRLARGSLPWPEPPASARAKPVCQHVVEVPDTFAIARWRRDGDAATIARCILATLKYEPHNADVTALRRENETDVARRA